jgi:glycosyltransferase involved in cell wall biosynthesis
VYASFQEREFPLKVVIACGAMAFGPKTPELSSLGGSEMAALQLSKALAEAGHTVDLFCNLPEDGRPDTFPSGATADGVTFHNLAEYGKYVFETEHDLTISVRDPRFLSVFTKSKKKVLWAHDIFTKRGMGKALDEMGFCFDEIWCVSEWHRQQIHTATGYPLSHIVALRNGIVKYENLPSLRREKGKLIYAARPERGLDNLIMPGGVMDHLPEFTLHVYMYEHFPEHMRSYYERIMARMKEMPNVVYHGGIPNKGLRLEMASAEAYIYPTQFEETSCCIAREAMEQRLPFLTTEVGALPETLSGCGLYFENWLRDHGRVEPARGTPEWCAEFAQFSREILQDAVYGIETGMGIARTDLYWDGVAKMVEDHAAPKYAPEQTCGAAIIAYNNSDTILRCLNSLVGNVDVISIALCKDSNDGTFGIIGDFKAAHPEIDLRWKWVPKIEPYKFGFDDARKASIEGLETNWILWIDTDEYLVGNIRKYLRNNHLQSYLISQHHFTVEPRGSAPQIDRPARLFRRAENFVCKGHIHEHFECPEGGPGRAYLLDDVDIGHTGYVNEEVRKARFHRNWDFLVWEMKDGSDRKLNKFLWLRDIVHRMRMEAQAGHNIEAIKLAEDAVSYYNSNYEDMAVFGPGLFQALQYAAEAKNLLGRGTPMRVTIQLEDRTASFEGKFDEYVEIERILKQIVEPELKDRSSKYYG